MEVKELKNMVYLLDDSDERVVSQIEEKIFSYGLNSIPFLESLWPNEESAVRQEKIVNLIKRIKQNVLAEELKSWLNSEEQDLLDGVFIINKILDPNIDRQHIENQLDKIKLDTWLELNYDLTSFEKVKILNRIIFDVHKFTGDTENYHHSKNSFLSSVLERKKGNPISLAVVYCIIAQRLNIPIYGVNLPQHFILGYVKDLEWPPLLRFNDESLSKGSQYNEILFYINPFNNGLIFNQENILKFLKQLKLEVKEDYFKICENRDIIIRILRNLEVSFSKENNHSKKDQVLNLIKIMMRED
ncbi:MAG: transglutaminase-like domain-containing protein [Bacteroidia bacterium]|nr:transglutaminase-like domain-containing protein [Bacteroidia bacterium]